MKQLLIVLLALSLGFNIFFIARKNHRNERYKEIEKLHCYKDIAHKEGYAYFREQLAERYPGINNDEKFFVVYRWDSLMYSFMHQDQMKVLDSMAVGSGGDKIDYIFVTEMEKGPSENFLKNNYDAYPNVNMLYGMDDFISGIYSLKELKFNAPRIVVAGKEKESGNRPKADAQHLKQASFYLIMGPKGKVEYTNENKGAILKDTAFLNRLNALAPSKKSKIVR